MVKSSIVGGYSNEGSLRRRPITPKQPDRRWVPRIGRVQDRTLRACYLCEVIFGQPSVFESESLYHMLMVCPHASMLNVRERLKTDLKNLCQMDADPLSPKPPEPVDESEL